MNPPDSPLTPTADTLKTADTLIQRMQTWGWEEWVLALLCLLIVGFILYIAARVIIHRQRLHRMVGTMREDLLLRRELAAMAAGKDPKSQRREQFLRMENIRMDIEAARKSMADQGINPRRTSSWLLLGEPGSGKSRLMESGGIEYPDGINDFSRAAEATSTFNLWMAEKGTIWDIGGRLFLSRWGGRQDQEWQFFLEQLHRIYRNNLLSGVILTIPSDALLLDSPELRDRKVTLIAEEMRALSRISGAYCPVWVVITKCDQIDGFSEFFTLLSEQDCEQPFGWHNPRPGDPFDQAAADTAFDHLISHLKTLRSSMALHAGIWEQAAANRNRGELVTPIYCLPDRLGALKDNLKRYLSGIFTHVQHKNSDRGLFQFQGFWFTATLDKPVTATERVIFEKKDGKLRPVSLPPSQNASPLITETAHSEHATESLVSECEKILSVASDRHFFTRELFRQLIFSHDDQSDYTDIALRHIQRPYWAAGLLLLTMAVTLLSATALHRNGLEQLVHRDVPFWRNSLDLFLNGSLSEAPIIGVDKDQQLPLTGEPVPNTRISRREFIYVMTNMANVPAPIPLFWRPASWIVDRETSPQLLKTHKDFIDKATVVTMLLKPAVLTSRRALSYRADNRETHPTPWEQEDTDCLATLLQITRYGILLMNGQTVLDDINYSHLIQLENHRGQDAAIKSLWMNCFERNKTLGTMTILNGYLRPVSIEAAQAISKASGLYAEAADGLTIYPALHYQQMKAMLSKLGRLLDLSREMDRLEREFAAAVKREDLASAQDLIKSWKDRYSEAKSLADEVAAAEDPLQLTQVNSLKAAVVTVHDALTEALTSDLQRLRDLGQELGDSQNADFLRNETALLTASITRALARLSEEADSLLSDELCRFWDRGEGQENSPRPWESLMEKKSKLHTHFTFPIPAGDRQESFHHRIARVQEARKQYNANVQSLNSGEDSLLNETCWEQNWHLLESRVLLRWLAEAPHSNVEVLVPEPGAKVARKLPAIPYTPAARTAINPTYDPIRANRRLADLLELSDYVRKNLGDEQAGDDLSRALQTLDEACQHYLTDYVMYWVETIPSYYRVSGIRNWAQFVESGDVMYSAEVGSILYELDNLIIDALNLPSLKDEVRFPQLTAIRELISKAQKALDSETRRNFQTSADFISHLPLHPGKAWQSLITQPADKLMNSYWVSWYPAPPNSSFLWWNTYLQHGMRLLKQEATTAMQADLAACLAEAGKFPLCDTSRRSSGETLSAFEINDLYDRLGAVAHLIDPQREEEIAKQAAARSIPQDVASLDLPIMGDHAASLEKLTAVLTLLADPGAPLTALPILPAAEVRAAALTGSDDIKRLIPVGRRFPYCRILCNGTPLTRKFNLNQQNAADLELLTEAMPASAGDLQFEFYRHSNADTPDSTLKLSSHWSALDLYLRPAAKLSEDKKTAYAPLIFRDREGYNCLFWFGMRFNRDMIPPADWPSSALLSSGGSAAETDLAVEEKQLRKLIRETYLTNRNLPRKPGTEEMSALRAHIDSLRQRGLTLAFQIITPGSAERADETRLRNAALYPYFSIDSRSVNTGKLRAVPDTSQLTPYQLPAGENILLRLYQHTQDEYSSQYLDQRTPLLDLVLNQASEYDPNNNYFVVPVSMTGSNGPITYTLYLRPCLGTMLDDGLLPDTGAPTLIEYPASDLPDSALPID